MMRVREIDWVKTTVLVLFPLVVIPLSVWYVATYGLNWGMVAFFFFYCAVTSISITGGYHRLYSHKSYDAALPVKLFYLLFGAAAMQNAVLTWASDHRKHHRFTDTEDDPYNINQGFFYAHMGWMFYKEPTNNHETFGPDLMKDKWVVWQHRYYWPVSLFMGFVVPTLVAWLLWDRPFGGLLLIGGFRTVFTHHCTYFINSVCHYFGKRPYSEKYSARDNALMAVFTYGEGYHNFHHAFQADYRNGWKWYHWDPTKWLIGSLSWIGGTSRLRRVSQSEILRARLEIDEKRLLQVGAPAEKVVYLKQKVEEAQQKARLMREEYKRLKSNVQSRSRTHYLHFKADLKLSQLEFKLALAQWSAYRKHTRKAFAVSR